MEPNAPKSNADLILREKMALDRTRMANYRTFLSFLRTSLYFPVAGISMHQALTISFGKYLQLGGILIGLIILIAGLAFYFFSAKRHRRYGTSIGSHFLAEED